MSCSFCTIPDSTSDSVHKPLLQGTMSCRVRAVITWVLLLIWLSLMGLGTANLMGAEWLVTLGGDNKKQELLNMIQNGYNYLEEGNYRQAKSLFTRALDVQPDAAEAFLGLGETYLQLGNNQAAVKMFLKALEYGTMYPEEAYFLMGNVYEMKNKLVEALEYYLQAELTALEKSAILFSIGSVYMKQKRFKDAVIALRRALYEWGDMRAQIVAVLKVSRRKYRDDHQVLQAIDRKLQTGIPDTELGLYAQDVFIEHREASSNTVGICSLLLRALVAQERYEEGIQLLEKRLCVVRKIYGDNHSEVAALSNYLGIMCQHIGRYTDAEKYYHQAIGIYRSIGPKAVQTVTEIEKNLAHLSRCKKRGDWTK